MIYHGVFCCEKTIMFVCRHTYKSYASIIQSLHHDNQSNNISMTYNHKINSIVQSRCYEPAQEKVEKIDQRLRIQPLRGGNLLYGNNSKATWKPEDYCK